MHTVLITFPSVVRDEGRHTELLRQAGVQIKTSMIDRALTADEMLPLVRDVDAIIAGGERIDARVFANANRLKVVSRHGVGYDAIDVDAATAAGVVVTITPGTNEVSVAELALGLMIAIARRIPQMRDMVLQGRWTRIPGVELAGKTLGIVGLGRIGKALAVRARAMEMTVCACELHEDTAFATKHDIAYLPLADVLRRSDFVSLHTPALPGAQPLIGGTELRLMKPSAFIVNTARGSLIDEVALYQSLTESRLAGAALDVFTIEPPGNHPLLALDNVVATPHIGSTREARARTALLATQNALQVLRGERCPHAVNAEVYRTFR